MKKAYVKPVFLAEKFEGTMSVAACKYHSGDKNHEMQVYNGLHLCPGNCSHAIGGGNGKTEGVVQGYWEYATNTPNAKDGPDGVFGEGQTYKDGAFLFTSGQTVCDFVWNSVESEIGIWTKEQDDVSSAISNAGARNPLTSFITFLCDFSSFFSVPAADEKNHRPGVKGEAFFS